MTEDRHHVSAREWVLAVASKIPTDGGPSLAIDSLAALLARTEAEAVAKTEAQVAALRRAAEHWSACDFPDEVDFRCKGCESARAALADTVAAAREHDERIRAEERERCAEVADNHEHAPDDFICGGLNCGTIIAAAIRALSPSKP